MQDLRWEPKKQSQKIRNKTNNKNNINNNNNQHPTSNIQHPTTTTTLQVGMFPISQGPSVSLMVLCSIVLKVCIQRYGMLCDLHIPPVLTWCRAIPKHYEVKPVVGISTTGFVSKISRGTILICDTSQVLWRKHVVMIFKRVTPY
jgi:hypothetical protein